MLRERLNYSDLERMTGISRIAIYRRMTNVHRWTLDDVDVLQRAGVPVAEFIYTSLPLGEIA